jgi:hypothetical protein
MKRFGIIVMYTTSVVLLRQEFFSPNLTSIITFYPHSWTDQNIYEFTYILILHDANIGNIYFQFPVYILIVLSLLKNFYVLRKTFFR